MLRKSAIVFLVAAFINFTIGCTSTQVVDVSKSDVPLNPEKIVSLTRIDGTVIQYDQSGATFRSKFKDRTNVVIGLTKDSVLAVTPIDSVLEARVERTEANITGTVVLVSVIVLLVILIAAASGSKHSSSSSSTSTHSCPYVYSYDGEEYRFEAEPLGGSTTEGLKRTDYSRLTHLVAEKGEYRILMRNENQETQFLDQANLLVIDHDPGVTVAPDYSGNFHSFRRFIPPTSVIDEEGKDVRVFLASRDDVRWQTAMPTDTSFRTQDVRHHLTFAFPKPKNTTTLSLYVNAGTAMWGSSMIREMLMMRGNEVDDWYRSVDAHGVEMERLAYFMDREELFTLKVNVQEGTSWVPRGIIHGGGPMADDARIVNLDVSHVKGDTVRLQMNPPRGYWKIDCVNAIEGVEPVTKMTELAASFGEDQSGKNVTSLLRTDDRGYYTMPEVGNQCLLRFAVPDQAQGTSRTIYLKSSGYYKLHLPKDTPEQTAFIWELGMNPGKIVEYSLEKYYQYRQQILSSAEGKQ